MMRTSETHPLKIASIEVGPRRGRIGVTFAPGKYDPYGHTGAWERDLATDLDAIVQWGAGLVLTLLEEQEMALLRIAKLGDEIRQRDMEWLHLPIRDQSAPTPAFDNAWPTHSERARNMLNDGKNIVVHCRGGLGRAGMIAARLLVELGDPPDVAIARVRAVRPGAVETSEQERWVAAGWRAMAGSQSSDWFERLMGFREGPYEMTRAKLRLDGDRLMSLVNGKSYGIGKFDLVSLKTLRERATASSVPSGKLNMSIVQGDVRKLHRAPEYAGALFQVASQFNALEMTGPGVTPEHGVTRYQHDHTQGPACAIAAGAATVFRNYFVPVAGGVGQTESRQLDGLKALGEALSASLGCKVEDLWQMCNGYALCSRSGLDALSERLVKLSDEEVDTWRGLLGIGVQWDVEVTDGFAGASPNVSQAFCSALPVAYTDIPSRHWRAFAKLVLDAAYEATLWAAVLNAQRGASNIVLLTLLGGGAFGNEEAWIISAIRRALETVSSFDLDVKIVSYGTPSAAVTELAEGFRRMCAR
jgi:protein-tyrosine phosphatase